MEVSSGNYRGNKNKQNDDFQMWNQKFDNKSKDLIEALKNCFNFVININNKINDDEKFNSHSTHLADLEVKNNDKSKNKNNEIKSSDKAKNCLLEAQKVMRSMKEQNNDILRENINYVMKNSKKYLFKENELPIIHTKNPNAGNHKPNPTNIKYINDTMRSRLMKAFTHFHPNIHLQNLKILLEKDDHELKTDLISLNKRIDRDEKEILDKEFYKKKYEKLMKEKEMSDKEKTGFTKIGSDTLDKLTQNTEEVRVSILNRNKSPARSVNKSIGENNKKKSRKIKDKYELDNLKDCIMEIINTIKEENVATYIDEIKDHMNTPFDKQFDKFFPCFKKAEDLLKNVQHNKYNRTIENELRDTKNNSYVYNDEMLKIIKEAKLKLLQIIHNNDKIKNEKSLLQNK